MVADADSDSDFDSDFDSDAVSGDAGDRDDAVDDAGHAG